MKSILLAMMIATLFSDSALAADDKNKVMASLKAVTVYKSGAEMNHVASAQLKQGTTDLIIEGVSSDIDVNSIQINCASSITILGIEFSNNYLSIVTPSSRIRLLQDSLEVVQKEVNKINIAIITTSDLLEVLKINRDIKGSQTGMSVAELMKLMDYYKIKSLELQNELVILRGKQKRISDNIIKINNQISEEESKNVRTGGRLILQLSSATGGNFEFKIAYIAKNAYWEPYYDVRVEDIKSSLKLIYKAKIVQTTGIDWKQVKLSLSTSIPNQFGNAPILRAWFLSYINPVAVTEIQLRDNRRGSFREEIQPSIAIVGSSQAQKLPADGSKLLYIVNSAIMSEEDYAKLNPDAIKTTQAMDRSQAVALYGSRANAGAVVVTLKSGLEDYVSVTDNELNATYDIDIPYDVATTGKEQTATLKEANVEAVYKYYSVPKLDKDAYLLAEISDWEKLNLLPGLANIILEGTYVGKAFIDPNSTLDTLSLALGRDKRVVIKREKLKDYSSVKFLGSNKLQKITYELTIKNNKKDAVKLLLKDQFPLSNTKEIEVDLVDSGNAAVNEDIGVLTWKIELAPGESKKVRFTYSVRYPKDKTLGLN